MENSELLRKLKESQLKKSRKLERMIKSPRAFEKYIQRRQNVVKIDATKEQTNQDAKELNEQEIHFKIPDFVWQVICVLDGKYTPMEPLKVRCHDRGLSKSGSKKALIWRLLNDEIKREEAESSYIMVKKAAEELDGLNIPKEILEKLCKERDLPTGNRGKKDLALALLKFEFVHKIPTPST